ncbi:MAG TPA: hypothetical protein VF553_05740 [Pyrinomonadaceae bacterium]|jgi:hypothetical protein
MTRIVTAALLALALLAGIVPFNALSFDQQQQTCMMSCCAGKPPHRAGSCGAAFPGEQQRSISDETAVEDHASMEAMPPHASSPEIIEAPSHCGTQAQPSTDEHASSRDGSRPAASLIAHALTTPCSPECAAAASLSAFSQLRRARDGATLAAINRPRPSSHATLAEHVSNLQTLTALTGRQSSPRAPPLFPENLPA